MARGFYSTFGVGTTDYLRYQPAPDSTTRITVSAWVNRNGNGGGNLGRVFELDSTKMLSYLNANAGSIWAIAFDRPGAVNVNMRWGHENGSGTLNTWVHLLYQHDYSVAFQTGLAWTRSGTTATLTWPGHPLETGDHIFVKTSSDTAAIVETCNASGNPQPRVTRVDANTVTFGCLGAGGLSGTISCGLCPRAYLNGVRAAAAYGATDGVGGATPNGLYIGNRETGPNTRGFDGQIQEVATWNRWLTLDEIAALAKRVSPALIPRGRTFYAPLIRDPNDIHGRVATVNGTAVQNHDRVIR